MKFRLTVWLGVRATKLLCQGSMWIDLFLPYGPMFDIDMKALKCAPVMRPNAPPVVWRKER